MGKKKLTIVIKNNMGKKKNDNKSSDLKTKKTALQVFADWMALTSNPEEIMDISQYGKKAIVFRRVDEEEINNSDQE